MPFPPQGSNPMKGANAAVGNPVPGPHGYSGTPVRYDSLRSDRSTPTHPAHRNGRFLFSSGDRVTPNLEYEQEHLVT